MSKREELKAYIQFSPRERRLELEAYIDEHLSDSNVLDALKYVKELSEKTDHPHSINELGFSDKGDFYIRTSTGITFIK